MNDYYKNIVASKSKTYDVMTRALDVVRKFIVDKNLILSGGMAIDFALKLKGDRIYSDNQIPDYDFLSPDHSNHAYELGNLLCSKGFENVSCITAMHMTTMKVRVDFEEAADISYCPKIIFDNLPTLEYQGFRFIHPHFQMMDQHRALAIPFENPGMEVIFHRWKKDAVRYDKLYNNYPIELSQEELHGNMTTSSVVSDESVISDAEGDKPMKMVKFKPVSERILSIPLERLANSCLIGWGAINCKITEKSVIIKVPNNQPVSVLSYDYKCFLDQNKIDLSKVKYYSSYFEKLPRKVSCVISKISFDIYDSMGVLVSAKQINKKHNVYICNMQYNMLFFLVQLYHNDSTPAIRVHAKNKYLQCVDLVKKGEIPSVKVYGNYNWTAGYLIGRKETKEKIYGIKATSIKPKWLYPNPPDCNVHSTFDYDKSGFFIIDGRELKEFMPLCLNYYKDMRKLTINTNVWSDSDVIVNPNVTPPTQQKHDNDKDTKEEQYKSSKKKKSDTLFSENNTESESDTKDTESESDTKDTESESDTDKEDDAIQGGIESRQASYFGYQLYPSHDKNHTEYSDSDNWSEYE